MRIYLACPAGPQHEATLAGRMIAERLQRHGHEVLTAAPIGADAPDGHPTDEEVYRRHIEWLSTCDVLVAEASGSSYDVGFEVGYVLGRARHTGQQIVLVYDTNQRNDVSPFVAGNSDVACCMIFGYRSLAELTTFVDEHFAVSPT